MSVTFWCPQAPRTQCVPYPESDPDFVDEVSELPEINVSNANARVFIELLGLPKSEDLVGDIEPAAMGAVIERLHSFLTVPTERAAFLEPTTVNGRVVGPAAPAPLAARGGETGLLVRCSPRLATAVASGAGAAAEAQAIVLDALVPADQAADLAMADRKRGGPTVVNFGRDDAYLRTRANSFLDLFTQARSRNYRICWG